MDDIKKEKASLIKLFVSNYYRSLNRFIVNSKRLKILKIIKLKSSFDKIYHEVQFNFQFKTK